MTAASPDRRAWHVDKSVSIGNIVTFLTLFFAGIGYVMHQDQRQTRSEKDIETLFKADARIELSQAQQRGETLEQLKEIRAVLEELRKRR